MMAGVGPEHRTYRATRFFRVVQRAVQPWLARLLVFLSCAGAAAATPPVATNDPFCATQAVVGPVRADFKQAPGTARMAARLQEILRTSDPLGVYYLNREAVPILRAAMAATTNANQALQLRARLANELLCAGQNAEALRELDALPRFAASNGIALNAANIQFLQIERALAHLRLGEQENCLLNHTSDSCLFPIRGAGIHQLPRGSRGAIGAITEMLARNPHDLGARWLLNVAHMTLGEYPDKVPPHLLIPPSAFASDYSLPRFPEAAGAAGLDVDDLAGGCIADDFDGDGLLDVMASSWSLHGQLRYFRNRGDGTFVEKTFESGLGGLTGALNLLQTDYNNDGHIDVLMLRGAWLGQHGRQPNSLLRNNGDGTFEDVTEEAGLLSFHPTQTATWFDFDNDGWLDLFIGNESYGAEVHPCELYRNNGNGTFTECAAAAGVAVKAFVKGVASGDYDNDGRPDLYLSCRDRMNILLHNDGPAAGHSAQTPVWRFIDASAAAGVGAPVASFPTWFFDFNNDGRLDIFVAGYQASIAEIAADVLGLQHRGERARLYRNDGGGKFTDITRTVGLYKVLHAMGANFGDFDNDGWLDFYLGTGDPDFATLIPNRAFRNDGGTNFQDVTTAGGLGHLQKGHGIAFADLDNDGDQDVYAVMGGAYSGDNYRNALFVNPGGSNHWLTLKLEGTKSNRAAIGARLRVVVETATGPRSIYKVVSSGGSFGASPLRQEFGLGAARRISAVEITWPVTGATQTLTGLSLDRFYHVREGAANAVALSPRKFQLATKSSPARHATARPHLAPSAP